MMPGQDDIRAARLIELTVDAQMAAHESLDAVMVAAREVYVPDDADAYLAMVSLVHMVAGTSFQELGFAARPRMTLALQMLAAAMERLVALERAS